MPSDQITTVLEESLRGACCFVDHLRMDEKKGLVERLLAYHGGCVINITTGPSYLKRIVLGPVKNQYQSEDSLLASIAARVVIGNHVTTPNPIHYSWTDSRATPHFTLSLKPSWRSNSILTCRYAALAPNDNHAVTLNGSTFNWLGGEAWEKVRLGCRSATACRLIGSVAEW